MKRSGTLHNYLGSPDHGGVTRCESRRCAPCKLKVDSGFVPRGYGLASLVACFLFLGWSPPIKSQPVESATEQSIKAAYLYKFAAYVEWPDHVFAEKSGPLTIGVFGADSLAALLRKLTVERTVNGRPIAVRRVTAPDELTGVQILFVSASGAGELRSLTRVAQEQSVLVVTESSDALNHGSVINFRPVDKRIRFDISLDSADKNRLKLSARLLAVANHVLPRQH